MQGKQKNNKKTKHKKQNHTNKTQNPDFYLSTDYYPDTFSLHVRKPPIHQEKSRL